MHDLMCLTTIQDMHCAIQAYAVEPREAGPIQCSVQRGTQCEWQMCLTTVLYHFASNEALQWLIHDVFDDLPEFPVATKARWGCDVSNDRHRKLAAKKARGQQEPPRDA